MPGKRLWALFLILCWLLPVGMLSAPEASAAEETAMAEEISDRKLITGYSGIHYSKGLFDKRSAYAIPMEDGAWITLTSEQGIGSLYLIFCEAYSRYTVTDMDTGAVCSWGGTGFVHEYLDLEEAFGRVPGSVTLTFGEGEARLAEIHAFTSGQVPDFVQKWEQPVEQETDLILFSTHSDDEQLFFAGILPYYAGELGYQVQVVYLTDHHNNNPRRIHELLDGLWAVGVKTYPVIGTYADYHTDSLQAAYRRYRDEGITEEELVGFALEQLRRFRPKVAVGHDPAGEYGHGMHMLFSDILCKAAEISADPARYPELAERYGVWDVPKTYLHLYRKNEIRMDWDRPLENFGGKTAYEVTRDLGFPAHKTQRAYYSSFFRGKPKASLIRQYSPCEYGLYRSTVGEDVLKNDFFENLTTYARDRQDHQELIRAEEARQQAAAEAEKKRLEEENRRIAQEQQAAALREAERRDAEQKRIAEEQAGLREAERRQEQKRALLTSLLAAAVLLGCAGIYAGKGRRKEKNSSGKKV